ncbi:MAG: Glu/Leu/Phe/Val dehydrogenase [Eubacteriales bacterium]|nr:Glu/Leu/Phe/Val dehydrogenase [Eubacteriales bacterium]
MKAMKINPHLEAMKMLDEAIALSTRPASDFEFLRQAEREICVRLNFQRDDGRWTQALGYRVQHSSDLGPYKGGLRYHPEVEIEELRALAFWMSLKTAILGLPLGGGKGGIAVDPSLYSASELARLTRAFVEAIHLDIGPDRDIPAPDVNTNAQTMAVFADAYGKLNAAYEPAVVTGKPLAIGGSLGRHEATGLGVISALKSALATAGRSIEGCRIIVQGTGNVGAIAALEALRLGAMIVGVSNTTGSFYAPEGISPELLKLLLESAAAGASVQLAVLEGAGAKRLSTPEFLSQAADVLIPAALENQIDLDVADVLQADFVIEGANGPCTQEADRRLFERGVVVVPDVLANAGGVLVSYYEWVQNRQRDVWSRDLVLERMAAKLESAYQDLLEIQASYEKKGQKIRLREAAYLSAIHRIVEAHELRLG